MLLLELLDLSRDLLQLLHAILAEVIDAEPDHLLDLLDFGGFRHDDEPDIARFPMSPGTRFRDRSFNVPYLSQ